MLFKSTIAAAAIAATAVLGTVTAAHADPQVGVSIGIGFGNLGGYEPDQQYYPDHQYYSGDLEQHYIYDGEDRFGDYPFHHRYRHYGWQQDYSAPVVHYGLSCASARNVVRAAGFRGARATNCSRPVYTYQAWKRGEIYRVSVNVTGRIVSVRPIY